MNRSSEGRARELKLCVVVAIVMLAGFEKVALAKLYHIDAGLLHA
jgi:hypothetical protein